ncbi:MAG: hypothetical protein P4L40_01835, partial [Terracidiphilus sp.]|nr:hypothetical protein [Terracidiphilus sp.]
MSTECACVCECAEPVPSDATPRPSPDAALALPPVTVVARLTGIPDAALNELFTAAYAYCLPLLQAAPGGLHALSDSMKLQLYAFYKQGMILCTVWVSLRRGFVWWCTNPVPLAHVC